MRPQQITLFIDEGVDCGNKWRDPLPSGTFVATYKPRCAEDANRYACDGYYLQGGATINVEHLDRMVREGRIKILPDSALSEADAEGEIMLHIQRTGRRG